MSRAVLGAAMAMCVLSIAITLRAQAVKNPDAAKIKNPVKASPTSIAAGKTAYVKYCGFCHNDDATGNGRLVQLRPMFS